jgi:D-galactarolactone cycloisomerase
VPRIVRIEPFVVSQRLQKPFSYSQWEYDRRTVCIVRVTADDGTYGWGEGYGPATVIRAGIEFLTPLLLDRDPLANGALWEAMQVRVADFARRGILMSAISALDLALWDLKGKLLRTPVHVLLGGRRREKVSVYATGLYFDREPNLRERLAREAVGYVEQGFRAVKMKVGLGVDEDAGNVAAVRHAIGDRARLMMDSNHAFLLREALALAERTAEHDIGWFEEPVSPDDFAGYRELRRKARIPIAGGECEYTVHGFHQLFGAEAVDIAQPDICACGGLTETQRIAALARAHFVDVTPHCWGTGIAFATGVHFLSTIDAIPGRLKTREQFLEMDRTENPLRDQLTVPRFQPNGGSIAVPDAPGLGVDVDLKKLEEFSDLTTA